MNVEEVFARVIGRQASEEERERLYRLALMAGELWGRRVYR